MDSFIYIDIPNNYVDCDSYDAIIQCADDTLITLKPEYMHSINKYAINMNIFVASGVKNIKFKYKSLYLMAVENNFDIITYIKHNNKLSHAIMTTAPEGIRNGYPII